MAGNALTTVTVDLMKVSAALTVALTGVAVAACGGSEDGRRLRRRHPPPGRRSPPPRSRSRADEKQVWAPLEPDRTAIPVLLYHGIGPESDFANAADAEYGVGTEDFATQMTMMKHAGYETIDLQTFLDFVAGREVDLPGRPLLLTFDDARADSWTGADGILDELGFNAVMFVDVGRVDGGDPEYLTWPELGTVQESGRWQLQLHSGEGHQQIQFGPARTTTGRTTPTGRRARTSTAGGSGWSRTSRGARTRSPSTIPAYRPLAFAPPYGNYGQDGTNDPRIPDHLLGWLTQRYDAIFTQDVNARARPGSGPPLGRLQVTRAIDRRRGLRAMLLRE